MDPETFEWEVVRDMKEGERIVGLDERGIVSGRWRDMESRMGKRSP